MGRTRRTKIPPPTYNDQGQLLCRVCFSPVTGRGVYCGSKCRDTFLIRRRPEYAAMRLRQERGPRCVLCGADEQDCFERYEQAVRLLEGTPCETLLLPFMIWQADHIRPVADNGGGCGLENLRLLCPTCHGRITRVFYKDYKNRKRATSPWAASGRSGSGYKQPLPRSDMP